VLWFLHLKAKSRSGNREKGLGTNSEWGKTDEREGREGSELGGRGSTSDANAEHVYGRVGGLCLEALRGKGPADREKKRASN